MACRLLEPLYLDVAKDKSEKSVIIEENFVAELHQHQVEGLRYLYRQFKKKKSGIILNDATGYGKKTQVVLFLNAIKHIVTQPLLVLCNETEIQKWRRCFLKWSKALDDIIFESKMAFVDYKIFINSFEDMPVLSRRNWSVAVVDDPVSLKQFKILKNIKAGYKIWVVSIDMKAHLNTFAAIYEWINPTGKIATEDFQADVNDAEDVVSKAVLLDCFFEDIVLRRGTSSIDDQEHVNPIVSPVKKVSRKNKDPSGKKVKRSKRRIISDDEDNQPAAKIVAKTSISSIRDHKEDLAVYNVKEIMETSKESSNENNVMDISSEVTDVDEDSSFQKDSISSKMDDNNYEMNETRQDEHINYDLAENYTEDPSVYDLDTIPDDIAYSLPKTKENVAGAADEVNNINKTDGINTEIEGSQSQELHLKYDCDSYDEEPPKSIINSSVTEAEKHAREKSLNISSDESILDDKIKDLEEKAFNKYRGSLLDSLTQREPVHKPNKPHEYSNCVNNETQSEIINTTAVKEHSVHSENLDDIVATPKKVEVNTSEGNKSCDTSKDDLNSSDGTLEEKIRDLEKKTYNKYKGSLLDSIF